jgi:solute carrier family 25 folate transporter 32
VIKTKLQAQGAWLRVPGRKRGGTASEIRYRGLIGTSRLIWKEEGVRGMYKGLGPLIMGYLPTWMVYFTIYERIKAELEPCWLAHVFFILCSFINFYLFLFVIFDKC